MNSVIALESYKTKKNVHRQLVLDEPLQFFVVPTSIRGIMWLAKNKILGFKLTGPNYNKKTGFISGTMEP